ncbi:MAG: hypothetical protein ACNI3A_15010 [Desulfovibrio sp.]|uniref:hypothetical protein n=1 Tax=Desulfovibrio sp. 7SRBS1 TaxID=3378064 RepID=UPI003B3CAA01
MTLPKFSLFAVLFVAVSLMSAAPVLASTKMSPEKCAAVGSAVVHCYDCMEYKYLGKASVLTGYEESGGEKYCVVANEAKAACASRFGVNRNAIGYYTTFSVGGVKKEEIYGTSCIDRVGKP